MNKKAKTKAQKADEDANLDEALDESFPGQRPALDDPASDGSGRDAEKTEETSEGRSKPTRDKAEPRVGRRSELVVVGFNVHAKPQRHLDPSR